MKTFVIALMLTMFFPFQVAGQQSVDAQALLGEWVGEYSQSGSTGKIYLTVKKVDGNKIYGVTEIHSQNRAFARNLEGDNEGTLDGNTIKWSKNRSWGEFNVDGKEMSGTIMAPSRTEVTLRKTK